MDFRKRTHGYFNPSVSCIVHINPSGQWGLLWYTWSSHDFVIPCCFSTDQNCLLWLYMVYIYPLCFLALMLFLFVSSCRLQTRDLPCVWKGVISARIRPSSNCVLLRLMYSSDVSLCMPSIIHLKMETSQIKAYRTWPCWAFKRCSCSTQVLSWCWRIPGTIISRSFPRSGLVNAE